MLLLREGPLALLFASCSSSERILILIFRLVFGDKELDAVLGVGLRDPLFLRLCFGDLLEPEVPMDRPELLWDLRSLGAASWPSLLLFSA